MAYSTSHLPRTPDVPICLLLQVEGKNGIQTLRGRMHAGGPQVLYHGSLAAMGAAYLSSYPWFLMVRGPWAGKK